MTTPEPPPTTPQGYRGALEGALRAPSARAARAAGAHRARRDNAQQAREDDAPRAPQKGASVR